MVIPHLVAPMISFGQVPVGKKGRVRFERAANTPTGRDPRAVDFQFPVLEKPARRHTVEKRNVALTCFPSIATTAPVLSKVQRRSWERRQRAVASLK